jgi:predicted protein tyrosine phosphatase
MVEIYPLLHVGCQIDYDEDVRFRQNWKVVHACKDPYHREALGYTSKGAPRNHPEYLYALREHRLILNLVDVENPEFFRREIIDPAIDFIQDSVKSGTNVLVHCNEGRSRGPSIAMIYLIAFTDRLPIHNVDDAIQVFSALYPNYSPGEGIMGFVRNNFEYYTKRNRGTIS